MENQKAYNDVQKMMGNVIKDTLDKFCVTDAEFSWKDPETKNEGTITIKLLKKNLVTSKIDALKAKLGE